MEIDLIQDKTILLSEKQAIVSQINVIDAQRQDLIVQLTIVNGIIEKYIDKKLKENAQRKDSVSVSDKKRTIRPVP